VTQLGAFWNAIGRENVKHYLALLKTVKTESEHQRILKLLAEERQKQKDAGDAVEDRTQPRASTK
jgi:hypothetical protein